MEGLANNKLIVGDRVIIDLTQDTIGPQTVLRGTTGHGKDGKPFVGECDFDANTQDADAGAAEILIGKSGYVRGKKVDGTMPNNESVAGTITTKEGQYSIPQGYHDGGGKVGISTTEKAKLIPENIRKGVTVLGVLGTMDSTEGIKPQSKDVTPSFSEQTVVPDEGFNCLAQVTVAAIPYKEAVNSAGGITVTIG